MHLCHAHSNRRHSTRGPYDLIVGALGEMNVHRFAMEFATPDAEGIGVLARFPADKILGLGVIDHTDRRVETPEEVVRRAEAALAFVPKERLSLNTDCGFAPSSVNPMDLDEAYLKLKALCRGAAAAREVRLTVPDRARAPGGTRRTRGRESSGAGPRRMCPISARARPGRRRPQRRTAARTRRMKPSRASGAIQRTTATRSWSGSTQTAFWPAPSAKELVSGALGRWRRPVFSHHKQP